MTTYREFFDTTDNVYALMLLVGKAHKSGTLTRQRLVQVAVRCCETVAWRMPAASRTALADVAAWAHGDDGVDLHAAAAAVSSATYTDATVAAAVYAARCVATADNTAANAAANVAAYAANAANDSENPYAAAYTYAALCDVVRDEIDVEEVCRALNVNPDEVMK